MAERKRRAPPPQIGNVTKTNAELKNFSRFSPLSRDKVVPFVSFAVVCDTYKILSSEKGSFGGRCSRCGDLF